jgi:hypothetical protein
MFVHIHKHQHKDTAQIISHTITPTTLPWGKKSTVAHLDHCWLLNTEQQLVTPAKQVPTKSIIRVWTLSARTVILL